MTEPGLQTIACGGDCGGSCGGGGGEGGGGQGGGGDGGGGEGGGGLGDGATIAIASQTIEFSRTTSNTRSMPESGAILLAWIGAWISPLSSQLANSTVSSGNVFDARTHSSPTYSLRINNTMASDRG